jgi:MoaA/NifB/PqqE/SkfB family radical SAM enzyme
MCDQWKTDEALVRQELSTHEWYSFIDSVHRMHALAFVITGGEPFLREDIFKIIHYLRSKKIASHICTNGTLLDERIISQLKESAPDSISVSLDSYDAGIHNELRGSDCFDRVIEGITLIRRNVPRIKLGVNCVITRKNFRDMYRIIPFVEQLGVEQIKFDVIHTNLMHRKKSLSTFSELLFNEDDFQEFYLEISKLIQATRKTKLLTPSSTFMQGISPLYGNNNQKLPCYAGYISCAVDALGWVSACDNFDGKENIREKPLEEIWTSSLFHSQRRVVDRCRSHCWDSTHAELNIRCSGRGLLWEFPHILREYSHYVGSSKEI